MFTGIIEEIGVLSRIERGISSLKLTIICEKILKDIHLGDSIAVNGVCLTVVGFTKQTFAADVMPETFKSTALQQLSSGTKVNLERAMSANGRFGGHFVSGHIDGTGTIIQKHRQANALYIIIRIPQSLASLCIDKGSIAVDGTSLTIFGVHDTDITISLIPQTQKETVLAQKAIGGLVNIECDMLVKYVQKIIAQPSQITKELTMDLLTDNGFI